MAAKNEPKEMKAARQARWEAWKAMEAAQTAQAISPSPARQGAMAAARERFNEAMKAENACRERFAS